MRMTLLRWLNRRQPGMHSNTSVLDAAVATYLEGLELNGLLQSLVNSTWFFVDEQPIPS
jgi:hypothetical protein